MGLRKALRAVSRHILRFIQVEAGAIAVITAVLGPVLIIAVGAGFEIGKQRIISMRIADAADAGTLAVVTAARNSYVDPNQPRSTALQRAQAVADQVASYVKSNAGLPPDSMTVDTKVEVGNNKLSVITRVTAQVPITLTSFLGRTSGTVVRESRAEVSLGRYIDIYVVIDNSMSMGVGATQDDIAIMNNEFNCSFACHFNGDTVTQAHNAGAKLKFDAVREAVDRMLDDLEESKRKSTNVRIALGTFSRSFKPVLRPTSDLVKLKAGVDSLGMSVEEGGTNFYRSITQLANYIGKPGSGTTAASPAVYVLLISDGIDDGNNFGTPWPPGIDCGDPGCRWIDPDQVLGPVYYRKSKYDPYIQGIDPTICRKLKDKGIVVMTLEVQYPIDPTSTRGELGFISQTIVPNGTGLKPCASSPEVGLSLTDMTKIDSTLSSLFQTTLVMPKLAYRLQ